VLFAEHGAVVVGCDINAEQNNETSKLVAEAGGTMHGYAPVDLGDPEQAETWVEDAASLYGRIDVVYNNASAAKFAPFGEIDIDDWRFTMRNEVDLVFFVTRFAWKYLIKQGGVVINTASVSGHAGTHAAPQVSHSAAKGAILAMTKQLAVEGAKYGVRAVSISPGVIESPATKPFLEDPTARGVMLGDALIQRAGQPVEVAQMALFLASDAASYITGSDFLVDGGRMAT
jgi:NAD(P)-dependent dehydrogenase (short-subunit alcohol dehydrogenase family)